MFTCDVCGKQFDTQLGLWSHTKVHSDTKHTLGHELGAGKKQRELFEQRQDDYSKNPDKCLCCGKELPYPKLGNKKKFCNSSCAATYNNTKRPKHEKQIVLKKLPRMNACAMCNKPFRFIGKGKRFCCTTCRTLYRQEHPKIITDDMRESFRRGGQRSASIQQKTRRSKNEIRFFELCANHFTQVTSNDQMFNGWDADVIIHDIKTAVLWNGKWHYEKITKAHSVAQVQNRDRIKINEIKKCGFAPYVVKDLGRTGDKANERFVTEQFNTFIDWTEKHCVGCGNMGVEPTV